MWLYDTLHKYLPFIVGTLTRSPAYLKNRMNSKVVAKPGTLSFEGGVFNPGALLVDDCHVLLLAKSQVLPFFKAVGKKRELYLKGSPVAFLVDTSSLQTIKSWTIPKMVGFPQEEEYAIEDLRLFKWGDHKMINHTIITKQRVQGYLSIKSTSSALSELDDRDQTLKFCALPKIDFERQEFEKNWVYAEKEEQLLLWYSVNPYRVLALQDEENFNFKTRIHQQLSGKITDPGGFGTMVSFSTNPIDFDEKHWLVIIHQFKKKITGRWYVHWAVLIDKATVLPVQITSKPIFTGAGARGRVPGCRYISSVVKVRDELLFFAGEGDVYVTVTKKKIIEIESLFTPI
ncbi:hypothetical protein NBC122_01543 [Chryseobacterium salivictor]|uniref:Uncharacterized protein n=1 Tax=Chryseobacterium salivictor TaxID=2547600 RepID=A0A4P6ZFG5_9FLAO|nr:hypothetical protein NBC122_01543 [Chryseobacterium salivictor]